MCVIITGTKNKPDLSTLEKCEAANSAGGGMAWVTKRGEVRYLKGIDAKMIHRILSKLSDRPWAVHFRLATVGGPTDQLCHPFPVSDSVSEELNGTESAVLFHNGHYGDWQDDCRRYAINNDLPLPSGEMSDSRALAWLVHFTGPELLSFIKGSKFVFLTPEDAHIYPVDMSGWTEIDGVFYSNTNWKHRTVGTTYPSYHSSKQAAAPSPTPSNSAPSRRVTPTPTTPIASLSRDLVTQGFKQDDSKVFILD